MVFPLHAYDRKFLTITFALILLTFATNAEAARRPSRVQVRSSASSSSSSSVKAIARPSRRTLMNGTSSSSSAATKATSTYPINLLTNQEWKIRITGLFDDYTGSQYVFDVQRKGSSYSITEQNRNLKTGKLEKQPTEWKAGWTTGYNDPGTTYFEMHHCWYKYEYIQEGFSCEYQRVPAQVDQAAVKGDWDFDSLLEDASDDYTVDIISKSSRDVPCNVKAETADDGTQVYYTKDSQFFNQTNGAFQCFENADAAKKAGYQQSYR